MECGKIQNELYRRRRHDIPEDEDGNEYRMDADHQAKTRTAAIDSMKKFGQNIVDFILTSKRSGRSISISTGIRT